MFFSGAGQIALVFRWKIHVPILVFLQFEAVAMGLNYKHVAWLHSVDIFKCCCAGHHGVHQLVKHGLFRKCCRNVRVGKQGLDFRSPVDAVLTEMIKQRFYAESVANQYETVVVPIVKYKAKFSAKLFYKIQSVSLVQRQRDFAIGFSLELGAIQPKRRTNSFIIIEFPIYREDIRSIAVVQWLVTRVQVYYRKPGMRHGQSIVVVHMKSIAIRPTVMKRFDHSFCQVPVVSAMTRSPVSCNSAHNSLVLVSHKSLHRSPLGQQILAYLTGISFSGSLSNLFSTDIKSACRINTAPCACVKYRL